jgi:2-polyprenyl-6-methoxyphenol hydroxylase-like FAD-dependent oxidoreductase
MPGMYSIDATAPSVLIVGAGPTGLTLACELARRGTAFRLIEASPGPQPGSRGKGLQPRTLEVFDNLGIADRVIANGRMPMPMRSHAPDGTVAMTGMDTLGQRPDVPYPTTLLTPQWRVEEALRQRLAEFGGAVSFGTSLQGFTQADGYVTATLVKDGMPERVTVRWLVGCDGGHSSVRKQAGIAFAGETREDVRMIIADVAVDGLDRDVWEIWRYDRGITSLCPLPSTDLFQFQASVAPGQDQALTRANMQAMIENASGRTDIHLHEPEWSSLWRANVRLADSYRVGNVFLAGDAAHIHSPAGGQGMNTGIQDAHNLGWKLAAVADGAAPALLDTYEAERRPVAMGVLELSNARLQQAIENRDIPVRRDTTTMQLSTNYRGSTLSHDDGADPAALRAGDRAPDATGLRTLEGECRLFDLTRRISLARESARSASCPNPPDRATSPTPPASSPPSMAPPAARSC